MLEHLLAQANAFRHSELVDIEVRSILNVFIERYSVGRTYSFEYVDIVWRAVDKAEQQSIIRGILSAKSGEQIKGNKRSVLLCERGKECKRDT